MVDEKLRVYSRLITLLGELPAWRTMAKEADQAARPFAGIDLDAVTDPHERRTITAALTRTAETAQKVYELTAELVTLANSLRIWAPRDAFTAAVELNEAYRNGDETRRNAAEDALVSAIRRDLRVADG